MPTASDRSRLERDTWLGIKAEVDGIQVGDVVATEAAVVGRYDPVADLDRRAVRWGFTFESHDLAELATFAAALSHTEADAWADDNPVIATHALDERRLLLADRIVHWAVPWLDQVGRCYPEARRAAHGARATLLALADEHRPAPDFGATEGLFPPGEDAFGPVSIDMPLSLQLRSLWSGGVVLDATVRSITGDSSAGRADLDDLVADGRFRALLEHLYRSYGARWRTLAEGHPGSARLWIDLARRADGTADRLSG